MYLNSPKMTKKEKEKNNLQASLHVIDKLVLHRYVKVLIFAVFWFT